MKTIKGISLVTLIIIIAAVAVVAAVLFFAGKGGFGLGGGKGDGEGKGNAEIAIETAPSSVTTAVTTEIITTKELKYIEVTVDGNSYIYGNRSYEIEELEDLITEISKEEDSLGVKLLDDNASDKAYAELEKALHEKNINYIEDK